MYKFSTGFFAGTMLGIGVMLADKKTMKKVRRTIRKAGAHTDWF